MKRILIESELNHELQRHDSFLKRSDVRVFMAKSSDDLLRIHRQDQMDLVVAPIDMPGSSMEQIAVTLHAEGKPVRLVLVTPNNRIAIEACSRCRPDAVVLRPVYPQVLLARAQQLLGVDWRVNIRLPIRVAVNGMLGTDLFLCHSQDISSTGILVETDRKLDLNTRLSCSFSLPGNMRIVADGEVVRMAGECPVAPFLYGIKFRTLSRDAHEAIENFIDSFVAERAS